MNLQELSSKNQKELFNYNSYFMNLVNLYNMKKFPNKVIFSGPNGIGKSTFAYHLINYIFSNEEEFSYDLKNFKINNLNRSYKLILNNTHPNFHLIDVLDDKKLKNILDLIKHIKKPPFQGVNLGGLILFNL